MSNWSQLVNLMSKSVQSDLVDYAKLKDAVYALADRERDPDQPPAADAFGAVAVLRERFDDLHATIKDARERGY